MSARLLATPLALAVLAAGCSGTTSRDVHPQPGGEGRLLFTGGQDGYLYTVDADGSRLRRLTRGDDWGAASVAWSPDYSHFAVLTLNVRRGSSALAVRRADGTGERRLATFDTDGVVVRWPQPGEIEVRRRASGEVVDVLAIRTEGGVLRHVGREPRGALSPDRIQLAFGRAEPDGDVRIYLALADGSGAVDVSRARSIGRGKVVDGAPSWSPDGARIAFLRDVGEGADVYVMDADGRNQRRLTRGARATGEPAFSPDGRKIAIVGNPDDDELQDLLVIPILGRRVPTVAASFDSIQSFAWRAEVRTRPPAVLAALPEPRPFRTVRTVSLALRDGSTRIVDRRKLLRPSSFRDLPVVRDVSPDGRSFAYLSGRELRVYDLASDTTRLVARLRRTRGERYAVFAPDGGRLLFRSGSQLRIADVRTGASAPLAESAWGPFFWLRDGRIAYRAADRRLTFAHPGHGTFRTRFELSDTRFSLTPDGRRLLYDDHCDTFVADVATGRRRRISGHLFVNRGAWAPDGSHFVLQWAEECEADSGFVWAYHTHDVLFDARGRRLAEVPGEGVAWSPDSRWFVTSPRPTGTETAGLAGLLVAAPGPRTQSLVLDAGNATEPFVLPGGWLLFARYDRPGRVADGDDAGALYIARVTPAPRR